MAKRLTQIGNSLGLIVERPILDLLKITLETDLDISTDGERLIIAPVRDGRGGKKPRRPPPPAPVRPERPSPRYGFPKKQPW